LISFYSVLSF